MKHNQSAKKFYAPVVVLVLLAMSFVYCTSSAEDDIISRKKELVSEARNATPAVTADDLAALIEKGENFTILDVRTKPEYDQGHIRNSVWTPRGKLEFLAGKGDFPPLDSKIVIYCRKDERGSLSAKALKELGFTDVSYLKGGFKAWVEAGFSIFNMHGELTVKIFERPESE